MEQKYYRFEQSSTNHYEDSVKRDTEAFLQGISDPRKLENGFVLYDDAPLNVPQ